MIILGIRCSNRSFSYAVMKGSRSNPEVIDEATIPYPKGFKQQESITWLYQEVEGLIHNYEVELIVIKQFEGFRKDRKYEDRVEHEAAITLSASHCGPIPVCKKVKSTIAKDLGLKGRPKYLSSKLDTSPIPGYQNRPNVVKDAILSAWSELK